MHPCVLLNSGSHVRLSFQEGMDTNAFVELQVVMFEGLFADLYMGVCLEPGEGLYGGLYLGVCVGM